MKEKLTSMQSIVVQFVTFYIFKNVTEICRFGREREVRKIKSLNVKLWLNYNIVLIFSMYVN